jgi:hypothetical protein
MTRVSLTSSSCSLHSTIEAFHARDGEVMPVLHSSHISRTEPLVQVDCACFVDLELGVGKSDIRDQSGAPFRSAPAELEPATEGWCRNSYQSRAIRISLMGSCLLNATSTC